MNNLKTDQEIFLASSEWALEYIKRNSMDTVKNNINFFSDIFSRCTDKIESVIEFGSNIGLNLHAINKLFNDLDISAIEISEDTVNELKKFKFFNDIYHESILDINLDKKGDFVFTKGVLIHINPEFLDAVYERLNKTSNKYIMIAEYYNPTPVTLTYRGNKDRLFKRDFAGEMLDQYPNLELLDYKFSYHRDYKFPQDDIAYFLLKNV